MFVVAIERFMSNIVVGEYGEHPVSTKDGGTWYPSQACRFLKLPHHVHFLHIRLWEKCNWKDDAQYIKDRTMNALMTTSRIKERSVN